MASIYVDTLQQAEQQHRGYLKFLQHLCESEAEDRRQRRIARLLKKSGLPDGKRLGNLDETLLPEKSDANYPRCWKAASWSVGRTCSPSASRVVAKVILWPP